jgi:hypothetical protein
MTDLSNISVKERNAEYFYESFDRFYRSGDYSESCQSLWKAVNLIIAAIASFEDKEIKTIAEAKIYLQKFVIKGEITPIEVSALESVYSNRLRNSGDDSMLSIQIERTDNLFRKLKKILKDYVMNGPPKEPTQSAIAPDSQEPNLDDSGINTLQDQGQAQSEENYD